MLKHSSEMLVQADMTASCSCCSFVGCTSMMRISRSTTSQRYSIGLKYGNCGGHLSTVYPLLYSRNQLDLSYAMWDGVLSSWKQTLIDVYTIHGQQQYPCMMCCLKRVLRWPECVLTLFKTGQTHAFMLLLTQPSQQKFDSLEQATIFQQPCHI